MPRIPPGSAPPASPSSSAAPSDATPSSTTSAAGAATATSAAGADAAGDTYASTGGSTAAASGDSALLGGLPDVLLERAGARVIHGDDPGDYYCEHMFFSAQEAVANTASVAENDKGEKLIGFLHVPDDGYTRRAADGSYTLAERHERSWHVVGAAMRGFFDDAAARVTGPVRMLLTGYGPFMSARNNPTGELVAEKACLDEMMTRGFGTRLAGPGEELPVVPDDPADTMRVSFTVKTPSGDREVVVRAQRFPVDDTAIDPAEPGSVQAAMAAFEPHAVLSMGVWGGDTYKAEHHADDGGLDDSTGSPRHSWRAPADRTMPKNFALARAIERGGRAAVSVPASTILTGGGADV